MGTNSYQRQTRGTAAVEYRGKSSLPFLKIDKGLEDEAKRVQLLKPMPELC